MCLLNSTPKIGIFHVALQMLRRGQICELCHIESRGKYDVTSLIKRQSTSFLLHMEPIYVVFVSIC